MNRYTIVDGLPFLVSGHRTFRVRWDKTGFFVGDEVKLASIPPARYTDREIKAKCTNLDSISKAEEKPEKPKRKKASGGK